jgi:hypothetical protein
MGMMPRLLLIAALLGGCGAPAPSPTKSTTTVAAVATIDVVLQQQMRAAAPTTRIAIRVWIGAEPDAAKLKRGRDVLLGLGVTVTGELDGTPILLASATRDEINAIAAQPEVARIDFDDTAGIDG